MNGSKSQNRAALKISDRIHVATYDNTYPAKLRFASGSIKAIAENKYPVKSKISEYEPTVSKIVAIAHESADNAIS